MENEELRAAGKIALDAINEALAALEEAGFYVPDDAGYVVGPTQLKLEAAEQALKDCGL